VTAFIGWGAYALIISTTVPAIMAFFLNLILLRIRPASRLDKKSLSKVWRFAKSQFGFNFINYFSRNIDKILVGRMMGSTALGNYSKSYQLLMMPNQVLLGVLNPVLLPVLSDYQDDVVMVRKSYLAIVHILALVGMPLSVFLSFESRDVIYVLFGSQWGDAVFPFTILALTVWIQMALSSTGAIFQTLGQTRQLFWNGCISAMLLVTSIVIGCLFGNINAVSVCLAIGFFLNFVVIYWMMMRYSLKSNLKPLLMQFLKPCICSIALAIAMFGLYAVSLRFNPFASLLINTVAACIVIFVSCFALGEWKYIKTIVKPVGGSGQPLDNTKTL
jgi:O-antigen/teichoic acid export membrane protein